MTMATRSASNSTPQSSFSVRSIAQPSSFNTKKHDFSFSRYAFPGKAHNDYWTDACVFGHFIDNVVFPNGQAKRPKNLFWQGRVSMLLPYVLVFLLTLVGVGTHLVNPGVAEGFRRGAFAVLVLTFLVHTATLFARMYLMDRPLVFVTNLYSSAVFIGWAAVLGCLLVERVFAIGLGNGVGALIGFSTSIVAHNLAAGGDTLEMMQAVLDTNFWLATHVTTVTLGYSATYVAGLIGVLYVGLGIATPYLRSKVDVTMGGGTKSMELGRVIGMILYGVVCFAVLFSFVGTVLGGIWADQSWGRFWGWDPKENGAVLIVIWNALILHARWSGLVKDRGVAVLALLGNAVTTWSWFGTNQLGVGLHAYGFNNDLQLLCTYLWILHGLLVLIGLTPKRYWASFAPKA